MFLDDVAVRSFIAIPGGQRYFDRDACVVIGGQLDATDLVVSLLRAVGLLLHPTVSRGHRAHGTGRVNDRTRSATTSRIIRVVGSRRRFRGAPPR